MIEINHVPVLNVQEAILKTLDICGFASYSLIHTAISDAKKTQRLIRKLYGYNIIDKASDEYFLYSLGKEPKDCDPDMLKAFWAFYFANNKCFKTILISVTQGTGAVKIQYLRNDRMYKIVVVNGDFEEKYRDALRENRMREPGRWLFVFSDKEEAKRCRIGDELVAKKMYMEFPDDNLALKPEITLFTEALANN